MRIAEAWRHCGNAPPACGHGQRLHGVARSTRFGLHCEGPELSPHGHGGHDRVQHLAQDYATGSISAKEAARAAYDAAERVSHVEPNHPSLRTAAQYLDGMFKTYGEAVNLRAQGKDDGERMHRAFTLASGAQDVLAKAQPTLQQQGCDVGPLL